MSYLTTQRARVFCFCYSEASSVALSLYALACFYGWRRGRFEGKGSSKRWRLARSNIITLLPRLQITEWSRDARRAPNAILALVCTLTFIPCPYPNYVALPKGMIIISSGAKMTHLHLLFETHQIRSSGLERRRRRAHLHLLPIIFKSWWEFWQICASLAVGKKCNRVMRDVPVLTPAPPPPPRIIARNAANGMQIKILHWANFLMKDSRLMLVLRWSSRKHPRQQPMNNQPTGHWLAVAVIGCCHGCSHQMSAVNSYFWAPAWQEVTIRTANCKRFSIVKLYLLGSQEKKQNKNRNKNK